MSGVKYWMGTVPEVDDFGAPILNEFVDGKTTQGPWALMTPESFEVHGVGLGTGRGQAYQRQDNGRWMKVGG